MFGLPPWVISDNGTHFVTEMQRTIYETLNVQSIFTPALLSFTNGKVERMLRTLQGVLQAFISEHPDLTDADWPGCIPAVGYILNTTPRRRLAQKSPMEMITGYAPHRPQQGVFLRPGDEALAARVVPYDFDFTALAKKRLEKLVEAVDSLAKLVVKNATRRGKHKGQRREHAKLPLINRGDFVLVRSLRHMEGGRKGSVLRHRGKAVVLWQGPLVVVKCYNHWLHRVAPMTMHQNHSPDQPAAEDVHVVRIRRFSDKSLNVTQDLVDVARADAGSTIIDEILDAKPKTGALKNWRKIRLQVSWVGFEESESTWEPIFQVFEDARKTVKQFLQQGRTEYPLLNHAYNELMKTKSTARPTSYTAVAADFETEVIRGRRGDLDHSESSDSEGASDSDE